MKKRVLILIVCCAVLAGCMLPVFGSGSDNALVTRSYLERTFFGQLAQQISDWVGGNRSELLSQEEEKLNSMGRDYLEQLGQNSIPAGMQYAAAPVQGGGERHDTVSLLEGSGVVWTAGAATVSGALIDLTDGSEVATAGALTAGHRYLAVQDSVLTVTSLTAYWSVEGVWSTTSDGVSIKEIPFTDVSSTRWYYENVVYVYNRGLFNGTSETLFSPDYPMVRSMLTRVLHRMAGEPAAVGQSRCSDIEAQRWYTDSAVWAVANGIVDGMTDDGLFRPDQNLTREEIALMLYQYARWLGLDTSGRADLSSFADSASVSPVAQDAVSWAVANELIRGYAGEGGMLIGPDQPVVRAQVAALLQRFEDLLS